ncbi:MAG TPA: arabinan endo-1,5-alpha-L-arabinosidase [Anaerolineae bacterium]|jgi:arabinan endo-1,5-alpha-L-arabinosidase
MKALTCLILCLFTLLPLAACTPQPTMPKTIELDGKIRNVHDPVMAKDGKYYLYSTGRGIPIRCSADMAHWEECGSVFGLYPDWLMKAVPDVGDLWAPDISFYSGMWHLYYAASTFGKNGSVIGLATNATLDPSAPNYAWVDAGEVIASHLTDDWNAIDPNLAFGENGQLWLAFGSFWSGIKLRRIDHATGKLAVDDATLYSIASRPDRSVSHGAIEGAFIVHRGEYYYLFVSFDQCCRGVDSTYKIMVGRAQAITGPYSDRNGVAMMNGGGTLLVDATKRWRGPGHNSVFSENGNDWIVYHAYDAEYAGVPTLQVAPLIWTNGWPQVAGGERGSIAKKRL